MSNKDVEHIEQRLASAAALINEGQHAGAIQVIRLLVMELNDEDVTEKMQRKLTVLREKCDAIIDAIKAALDAENVDSYIVTLQVRWQSAVNVEWMATEYYRFAIKVLSEANYYNP